MWGQSIERCSNFYLDYEGTRVKKSDNDDDDFNEWGMDGDDEEYV
jgi:hypothetical protein